MNSRPAAGSHTIDESTAKNYKKGTLDESPSGSTMYVSTMC